MKQLQRILHVEDEPHIREVAKLALEIIGQLTVESCASGQQALDKAVAFGPDLLLLDVMMPGMDGPETLAALRALPGLAEVPAIFMTAKTQAQEIQRFKDFGAMDVVVKPFDPATLAEQIKQIWSARHGS